MPRSIVPASALSLVLLGTAAMADTARYDLTGFNRVLAGDGVEVVIEATGHPRAGIRHAQAAIAAGVPRCVQDGVQALAASSGPEAR